MKKLEYKFRVVSEVTAVADFEKGTSAVKETKVLLECSNREARAWKDNKGVVNEIGMKAQTQGLIQGLVANIHYAHQKEMWNSAEHLRYIINELERGFAFANAMADTTKM